MNKSEIKNIIQSQIVKVEIAYLDFDGIQKVGQLEVNKRIVSQTKQAFQYLYENDFKINSIELSNSRNDYELIKNNITTAYNFREVISPNKSNQLSKHAWGLAIDINPLVNPAEPNLGAEFIYDSPIGKLSDDDVKALKEIGFFWGGDFKGFWDSHHFEIPFTEKEKEIHNSW